MDEYQEFMEGLTGTSEASTEEVKEEPEVETEETETPDEVVEETEEETEAEVAEEAKEPQEETFTLKVNKEEKNVSRDEVISLAQKGSDYDRVKGQLHAKETELSSLQEKLNGFSKYEGAISIFERIAKEENTTVDAIVRQVRVNLKVGSGMSQKEAEAEIRAEDAEAKLQVSKPETREERAAREISEFAKKYPSVQITEELCTALTPDIQKGNTFIEAYENHIKAEKDNEVAELKRQNDELRKQLAADNKNKKNRRSSPGSQSDSGGKSVGDGLGDFKSALFG